MGFLGVIHLILNGFLWEEIPFGYLKEFKVPGKINLICKCLNL